MKKRTADWTDFLAGSSIPNGDEMTYVDTNGTTFGLDGFLFDGPDGAGALDGARLPESKGLSHLPDGIVTTAESAPNYADVMDNGDGFVLDEMLSEEEGALPEDETVKLASNVVNLDWLDPTQDQDPNRLPEKIPIIPQLDDQWGGDHRTDGLSLVPNIDKDVVDLRNRIQDSQPASQLPQDVKKAAIQRAARLLHYGNSLRDVLLDLAKQADVETARAALPFLKDDASLAGKVFVRASVFPDIRKGGLTDLKRIVRGARWVITEDQLLAQRLGMEMVSEVPWDEAVRYYLPKLAPLAFQKLASYPGDPKRTLRAAFALASKSLMNS